ncbi:MAG: hypothetical protein AAF840_14430, partial [Bacteroidota bacterium]
LKLDGATGLIDTLASSVYSGIGNTREIAAVSYANGGLFIIPGLDNTMELWRSDGSQAGTQKVTTLSLIEIGDQLFDPVFVNQQFFITRWRDFAEQLVVVSPDGTEAIAYDKPAGELILAITSLNDRTIIRTDQAIFEYHSPDSLITVYDGANAFLLDFTASEKLFMTTDNNIQLWLTDGTPERTRPLATVWDDNPDARTSIAIAGDKIMITTRTNFEERLLVYDLRQDTTYHLSEGNLRFRDAENALAFQGRFYLNAVDERYGDELQFIDFNPPQAVSGITYHDADQSNTFSAGDPLLSGIRINAVGNTNNFTFSNEQGQYGHFLLPGSTYTISASPTPCWELSTTPTSYDIVAERGATQTANFGFSPVAGNAGLRPLLTLARPRCSFEIPAWITLLNDGCQDLTNVEILVTLPPDVTFVSADLPPLIDGQNLRWEVAALAVGQTINIPLILKMPGEDANGELIDIELTASGLYEMDLLLTEQYLFSQPLSCAIDPNDKQVTPSRVEPSNSNYTQNDETLTYTIRFQNTGTDTAFNVRLEDQLSNDLDWPTLRPIAASHPYRAQVDDKGLLQVFFDNILLPDSNVNEALSNGFFVFDIQ